MIVKETRLLVSLDGKETIEVEGKVKYNPPYQDHNNIVHKQAKRQHSYAIEIEVKENLIKEVADVFIYDSKNEIVFNSKVEVCDGVIRLPEGLELNENEEYHMWAIVYLDVCLDVEE